MQYSSVRDSDAKATAGVVVGGLGEEQGGRKDKITTAAGSSNDTTTRGSQADIVVREAGSKGKSSTHSKEKRRNFY